MLSCGCPAFEDDFDCKHCVAAALTLRDHIADDVDSQISVLPQQQKLFGADDNDGYAKFKMDAIDTYVLQRLAGNLSNAVIGKVANSIKPGPIGMPHQYFSYYEKSKKICDIEIIFDAIDGYKTRCTCGDKKQVLCKHVVGGFAYLNY